LTAVAGAGAVARPLGEPIDRLMGVYALVAGTALLFPHRPDAWPLLAAAHLFVALAGFGARPIAAGWNAFGRRWPRTATFIGDWYALAMIPWLYLELAILNRAVFDGRYFDEAILRVEAQVFGGQPSRDWAQAANHLLLSEVLHAAYLSYYLIIYVPPIVLYARGMRREFRAAVFAVMLTFFVHYVFFIYFPVQGPRYLFPAPTGAIAGGFFYQLAHRVLEAGSSQGAAFPSSHVGVSLAQSVATGRSLPALGAIVAVLTLGLALGAIYGGFHYATDAVTGALLGLIAVLVAPRLHRKLDRDRHRP
jgi:membrane-associated phospholipid phosphatase